MKSPHATMPASEDRPPAQGASVPHEVTGHPRRVIAGSVSWRDTFAALRYRNFRLLNGFSFSAVIVGLLLMRLPKFAPPAQPHSIGRQVIEMFTYVARHRRVRILLLLFGVAGIFGWSSSVLLPAHATDILRVDEGGFGAPLSADGIGGAAETDGALMATRFQELTRASLWRRVRQVSLSFPTYHPQGMALVGDCVYLSSVEVIDRSLANGRGHFFETGLNGELHRQVDLGEAEVYHPGGIDFDGQHLWVPVAEYRPDSRSIIYRIRPETLEPVRVFEFGDHLGALVCDRANRRLVGVSWGSRRFYVWELLELKDLRPKHQLPLKLRTTTGQVMTRNRWEVRLNDTGLRFFFIPEDNPSTLYIYDTGPSPASGAPRPGNK